MRTPIESHHFTDPASGTPTGGTTFAPGFAISWQNGPLVDAYGARIPPNGAFVENVILAAQDRLQHYQSTRFACEKNKQAIEYLRRAMDVLDSRTKRREAPAG